MSHSGLGLHFFGSPAHAGIDPAILAGLEQQSRFPRTRGDRPWGHTLRQPSMGVPPHTRG